MKDNTRGTRLEGPGLFRGRTVNGYPLRSCKVRMRVSREERVAPLRERMRSRSAKDQPCYVYLMVHSRELRFKIGLSADPDQRLRSLPEAQYISVDRSFRVRFPARSRAGDVERVLHRALREFQVHLQDFSTGGPAHDGKTEWFDLSGLSVAVQLLKAMPILDDPKRLCALEDFSGAEWQDPLAEVYQTAVQKRRYGAADHNLRQIACIVHLLELVSVRLPMRLERQVDRGRSWSCLQVERFRVTWEPDVFAKARMQIMEGTFWNLHTGKARRGLQAFPLVRMLRYLPDEPDTLELRLSDSAELAKLPAGSRVLAIWEGFCSRLASGSRSKDGRMTTLDAMDVTKRGSHQ